MVATNSMMLINGVTGSGVLNVMLPRLVVTIVRMMVRRDVLVIMYKHAVIMMMIHV